jgi:hypothetical protein
MAPDITQLLNYLRHINQLPDAKSYKYRDPTKNLPDIPESMHKARQCNSRNGRSVSLGC